MRIRRQLAVESGVGQLIAGGDAVTVNYTVITWGTFDGETLCLQEKSGSFEGDTAWQSGVAELVLESGESRRILLRRSGTFAMSYAAPPRR